MLVPAPGVVDMRQRFISSMPFVEGRRLAPTLLLSNRN
jgi:hypothetical protein